MFIYEQAEVEAFGDAIVDPKVTHQKLFSLTQTATDRFNGKLKTLNDAIDQWDKAWEKAHDEGSDKDMEYADVQRSEYCKARDELMIFSESLTKFVRSYEYIAQLIDFGDPSLEAFASYARLLRKRQGHYGGAGGSGRPQAQSLQDQEGQQPQRRGRAGGNARPLRHDR